MQHQQELNDIASQSNHHIESMKREYEQRIQDLMHQLYQASMNYPAQKQPQEKEPAKAHPIKNLPVEPAPSKEDTPAFEQPLSQTEEHFKGTACAD